MAMKICEMSDAQLQRHIEDLKRRIEEAKRRHSFRIRNPNWGKGPPKKYPQRYVPLKDDNILSPIQTNDYSSTYEHIIDAYMRQSDAFRGGYNGKFGMGNGGYWARIHRGG